MKQNLILLFLFFCLISCAEKVETENHQFNGEALGTTYMVKYFSGSDIHFEKAMDSIMEEINASMSTYRTKSDISRINRGEAVKVDEHFRNVFEASSKVFKESKGFFDPTVGTLVNAYGFGPEKPLKQMDSTKLDSLMGFVGFSKLNLTADNYLEKENPTIYLDFNAIAKGYAIDVVAKYLESKNVEDYLIELGGELRAKGINLERDSNWVVGIDHPIQSDGERELYGTVKLKNAAMATSGNYRKYRIDSLSGMRYVHTINPKTGQAEKSNLLSASVITENCMLSDAYATAFMAMGLERSKALLKKLDGVEAYLMYSIKDEEIEVFATPGFDKHVDK